MDSPKRTCSRTRSAKADKTVRGAKQIVVPMDRVTYDRIWNDAAAVRAFLTELLRSHPELFPAGMDQGFELTGHLPESRKLPGVRLRQLRLSDRQVFTLRPSFVFPYMTGFTDDLASPLLLLSCGVPIWLITHVFGRNDMFWNRSVERLGCNSLVGTTVRIPKELPPHLAADEHHTHWCGTKGYVAMTAGGGCILGVALTPTADEEQLTNAYEVFRDEAQDVDPTYKPKTVNTDGWQATQNAWIRMFTGIVIVLCFLHGFLKIRDRCRKCHDLHRRIWDIFRGTTAGEFLERMTAWCVWWKEQTFTGPVREVLGKLDAHKDEYARAYENVGCHRTSNMVDRLMNRLYRLLYAGRGLHGHQKSSELRLRGWALLLNFRPFAPRGSRPREHQSPAHRLNGKKYHDHWLHNLQISASMGGFRHT